MIQWFREWRSRRREQKEDFGRDNFLQRLLEDVQQRQVNTIVADGIVGRSVPHPVRALVDIANSYVRQLRDLGIAEVSDAPVEAQDGKGWLQGNAAAFEWLSDKAADALEDSTRRGEIRVILRRIVSTSEDMKTLATWIEERHPATDFGGTNPAEGRRPEISLRSDDAGRLVKAWELGTSQVKIQTTVGLDGDIVTRIDHSVTGDEGAALRELHNMAVDTSLTTWQGLIDSIGAFVGAFVSLVRPAANRGSGPAADDSK